MTENDNRLSENRKRVLRRCYCDLFHCHKNGKYYGRFLKEDVTEFTLYVFELSELPIHRTMDSAFRKSLNHSSQIQGKIPTARSYRAVKDTSIRAIF